MNNIFDEGYKIRNQFGLFFLTFTVEGWIDIFTRNRYRDILIKNLQYCRKNKSLRIGAYVIMSNHVHIICQSETGKLSDTIRDLKSFSTKEIINSINEEEESRKEWMIFMFRFYAKRTNQNKEYKLWRNGNHSEEILTEKFLKQKIEYIHENPVRSGIVLEPQHYLYSSAANYILGEGIMEIDFLF